MSTVSAYFLDCFRPTYGSVFCFKIEKPTFINLNNFDAHSQCKKHPTLTDHCLNIYNSCTDPRAWSLDEEQQRRHFLDVVNGYIPICTLKDSSSEALPSQNPEEAVESGRDELTDKLKEERIPISKESGLLKTKSDKELVQNLPSEIKPTHKSQLVNLLLPADEAYSDHSKDDEGTADLSASNTSCNEAVIKITDQIVNKVKNSLDNLKLCFKHYVEKNKKINHNLVQMLTCEKHKQRELECCYRDLKKENECLENTINYQKMVNNNQKKYFQNELYKTDAIYKIKISQLEIQLQKATDKLQYHKKAEEQHNELLKSYSLEIDCHKHNYSALIEQYKKLSYYFESVKSQLGFMQPISNTTSSYTDMEPEVKEVLKNSLQCGISRLNVEDLSIIHDAIRAAYGNLCHTGCGKNTLNNESSNSCYSTMYIGQEVSYRRIQGYD